MCVAPGVYDELVIFTDAPGITVQGESAATTKVRSFTGRGSIVLRNIGTTGISELRAGNVLLERCALEISSVGSPLNANADSATPLELTVRHSR